MLTFLRKIRKSLIQSGSTRKYLLYAIGEIALVVIGILIALQINNWNTDRKNRNQAMFLLENQLNELAHNIWECNRLIRYYADKDSIYWLTIQEKITIDDYKEGKIPSDLLYSWRSCELLDNAFNSLIAQKESVPQKFQSIIADLQVLNNAKKNDVERDNDIMAKDNYENMKFFEVNYPWFSRFDEKSLEERFDFMVNSWDYRNRVYNYGRKALGNHFSVTLFYRKLAIEYYIELAKLLGKPHIHENFATPEASNWIVGKWKETTEGWILEVYSEDDRILYTFKVNDDIISSGESIHVENNKFLIHVHESGGYIYQHHTLTDSNTFIINSHDGSVNTYIRAEE